MSGNPIYSVLFMISIFKGIQNFLVSQEFSIPLLFACF